MPLRPSRPAASAVLARAREQRQPAATSRGGCSAAKQATAGDQRCTRCVRSWGAVLLGSRSPLHASFMVGRRVRPRANMIAKKLRKSPLSAVPVGDTVLVNVAPRASGPLVLVVEDEPEIAALMRDFLEADGFRVLHAGDADQAVAALRTAPDCVLLDVMLPGRVGVRPLPRDPHRLGGARPVPERSRRRRRQAPRPRPRRRRLHREVRHPGRGRRPGQSRPTPLQRRTPLRAAPLRPTRDRPRRARGPVSPAGRRS